MQQLLQFLVDASALLPPFQFEAFFVVPIPRQFLTVSAFQLLLETLSAFSLPLLAFTLA